MHNMKSSESLDEKPMSVIYIQGLRAKFMSMSLPKIVKLTVNLEKIKLKDPQIQEIVKYHNPKMDPNKIIKKTVLTTIFLQENNSASIIEEQPESHEASFESSKRKDFYDYVE